MCSLLWKLVREVFMPRPEEPTVPTGQMYGPTHAEEMYYFTDHLQAQASLEHSQPIPAPPKFPELQYTMSGSPAGEAPRAKGETGWKIQRGKGAEQREIYPLEEPAVSKMNTKQIPITNYSQEHLVQELEVSEIPETGQVHKEADKRERLLRRGEFFKTSEVKKSKVDVSKVEEVSGYGQGETAASRN